METRPRDWSPEEVSGDLNRNDFGERRAEEGYQEGQTVGRDNSFGSSTRAESREAGLELAGYFGLRNFVSHAHLKAVDKKMKMLPHGERS